MSSRRIYVILIFTCIVSLLLAVSAAAQTPGQYVPTDCPDNLRDMSVALECGQVTVPLYHEDVSRGTIQLAVFRMRAAGDDPAEDPLVLLQGGPGGSVKTLVEVAASGIIQDLLADRDLVFIEQRGNLYSEPALVCPTYTRIYAEALQSAEVAALETAERQAISACLAEFTAAGVDLAAFDSYENARDIPLVVLDGLGYSSYNLYGVSYGSLLAQHVMEIAPRGLRSVILDAVAPRGVNPDDQSINYGWRALDRLLQACDADEVCRSQYPDLRDQMFDLIERLNASPVDISITDPGTGAAFDIKLNGSRLAVAIFNSLYDTGGLYQLPSLISASVARDDFDWAAAVIGSILDSSFSVGMHAAVNCAERVDPPSEPMVDPDVPEVFAQALMQEQSDLTVICQVIDVPPLPDEARTPADVSIPTLLMSGEFDPITPPDYGEQVARALPNATHVVFPGVAHGALFGTCPQGIARDFLRDPNTALDTSCVQQMGLTFRQTFELVEYQLDNLVFLAPKDWAEVERGTYTDFENVLLVSTIEGSSAQAEIDNLLGQLEDALADGTAEIAVQREAQIGEFTWQILQIDIAEAGITLIAAGTDNAAQTHLVQLQTPIDRADSLAEDVLIPLLISFRVE